MARPRLTTRVVRGLQQLLVTAQQVPGVDASTASAWVTAMSQRVNQLGRISARHGRGRVPKQFQKRRRRRA